MKKTFFFVMYNYKNNLKLKVASYLSRTKHLMSTPKAAAARGK